MPTLNILQPHTFEIAVGRFKIGIENQDFALLGIALNLLEAAVGFPYAFHARRDHQEWFTHRQEGLRLL